MYKRQDLEGADFTNADLRAVNFSGASLFGATFCRLQPSGEISEVAKFDAQTQFAEDAFEALTDVQQKVVRHGLQQQE